MLRMKSIVLVAVVVASSVPAGAQTVAPVALNARFSPEALRLAVATIPLDTTVADTATRPDSERAPAVNRSWDALSDTIRARRKVVVTLATSERVEGRVRGLDARAISLDVDGAVRTFAADDVVRIRAAGVRRRHIRYGMLAGGAIGWLVGAAVPIDRSSRMSGGDQEVAAAMAGILAGLVGGAITGAMLPVGPPLYESATVARIER